MAIERIPDPNIRPTFPGQRNPRTPGLPVGSLTGVLIGVSVVVAILSKLGKVEEVNDRLYITRGFIDEAGLLPEVMHGQVWRLVTPIFLHFGLPHILFNLLALKDLGTAIERVTSTRLMFALVLVSGVVSNAGQFAFAGPFFGGMSGVVYALFGFVWMKAKFDPASGFRLDKQTVIMMIGWFFLCVFQVIPHVANYAHGFGLGVGMIWGFAAAKIRPSRRRGLIFP